MIKSKECYIEQFNLYKNLDQANYWAMTDIEKTMMDFEDEVFTAQEAIHQIQNLFYAYQAFDDERNIRFLDESTKVIYGERATMISPRMTYKKFTRIMDDLTKKHCANCNIDDDCNNVDCTVLRSERVLRKYLKEECKDSCVSCTRKCFEEENSIL